MVTPKNRSRTTNSPTETAKPSTDSQGEDRRAAEETEQEEDHYLRLSASSPEPRPASPILSDGEGPATMMLAKLLPQRFDRSRPSRPRRGSEEA